jgi:hypothetical protein
MANRLKLKLLPKDGEGCYLAPLRESDLSSSQYAHLKHLLGAEYFRDNLPVPPPADVQIEEVDTDEAVDIDIDPNNINDEEVAVIKALYEEDQEYEEIEDDFMLKANLDEVLEEYKEEVKEEDPPAKVSKAELEEAMNEFVEEHKTMLEGEHKIFGDFEKIPYEQDHVLQAALTKEESSEQEEEKKNSGDEESEDDVVSNASHFTNTDNRPEVVSVRLGVKKEKKKETREEGKTEEIVKKESGKRDRNETKEEKKARKEKIKVEKKAAREEKKKVKEMYKVEKEKISQQDVGKYDIRPGTSVLKLN